jgi:hypothetical protein
MILHLSTSHLSSRSDTRNPGNGDKGRRLKRAPAISLAVVMAFLVMLPGCREKAPAAAATQQKQQEQLRSVNHGEALLKAVGAQLADLPSAVDTQLRPPVVILDSTKSSNGQDVLAVCMANPKLPNGPINVLRVPRENGRFKALGVRSGDIVRYFVLQDQTVDEQSRKEGLSRQVALELRVAQVLDESTLLVDTGLYQTVDFPAKIEVWRQVDDRLIDIRDKLLLYVNRRLPPLAWEPAPDEQVFVQVVTWLNQWLRQSEPQTDWTRDPLLDSLSPALAKDVELAKQISPAALAATAFQPEDGRFLQEAVWLRDISHWAQGERFEDLSRATALFDWTVRNVQLESDENAVPRRPWQVLLYGRGSAEQRTSVFALLARQQGLDVVMIAAQPAPTSDGQSVQHSTAGTYWLPALFSQGQLYLFDARLGLPIAGPDGKGVATLDQLRKDDALLRQHDIDDQKYPLTADSLKSVAIALVADPFSLSRRASQMEANLTGNERLKLAARPSDLAGRLKSIPGVSTIQLWNFPFEMFRDLLSLGKPARHGEALEFEPFAMKPALWKGRTRHFQGRHEEALGDPIEHKDKRLNEGYLSKSVRPTEKEIAASNSVEKRRVDLAAKWNAAYWIGLMSFDDCKYEIAAHWLNRPELQSADSPWLSGARYNLARTYEAQGKLDDAAKLLEQDKSPQRHGNLLRAKELRARIKQQKKGE